VLKSISNVASLQLCCQGAVASFRIGVALSLNMLERMYGEGGHHHVFSAPDHGRSDGSRIRLTDCLTLASFPGTIAAESACLRSMRLCIAANGATKAAAARMAAPRVKSGPEVRPVASAPLTAVVHDAVRRWFQETHKEAQRGDVVGFFGHCRLRNSLYPSLLLLGSCRHMI
jgi:hypothetical protein